MSRYQSIKDRLSGIGLVVAMLALGLFVAAPAAAQPDDAALLGPINDEDKLGAQAPPEQAPEQPVQDKDADADTDEAVSQSALESELASAKRFEVELDALLLPDGQLDTSLKDAKIKLNSVATRCGILANSAMHDEVKLVLMGYQARALAALASIEPAEEDLDRLEQLNDLAQQIAAIDLPGARAAADYWLLVAEMAHQGTSKQSPSTRQANIERALRVFIEMHHEEPAAAEYLLDTRLSLAQLLDQRGAQRDAVKQLNQIGKLPADSPRLVEIKRLRDSIARLGTKIDFESISTRLLDWHSSDHLGKPLLIHVYSDAVDPSVRLIDGISRRIVEGSLTDIAVVSLRVGDPVPGTNSPLWPTLPIQLERGGVLDRLGVTALPTLAWLDSEGRLAAIGTTAAVLNQIESLQAEPVDEAIEEENDTETEPETEQGPAAADPDNADKTPDTSERQKDRSGN
jgi:hypothetical protein